MGKTKAQGHIANNIWRFQSHPLILECSKIHSSSLYTKTIWWQYVYKVDPKTEIYLKSGKEKEK